MFHPDEPSYECVATVGDTVSVTGMICTSYDTGGTKILTKPMDAVACVITTAFWDYETGWRFHGRVLDQAVVDNFREQATTGFTVDYYRTKYPNAPHLAEATEKALMQFDPSYVYFSEHDIERDQ